MVMGSHDYWNGDGSYSGRMSGQKSPQEQSRSPSQREVDLKGSVSSPWEKKQRAVGEIINREGESTDMPSKCPRCRRDLTNNKLRNSSLDWELGGKWACTHCGYTHNPTSTWHKDRFGRGGE